MTAAQDSRAQFEKNELANGRVVCLNLIVGRYTDMAQQSRWETWQASRADLSAEPVAVPQGWKLVPIEPTEQMLSQFDKWDGSSFLVEVAAGHENAQVYPGAACAVWEHMLAAATQPAAQERKPLTDEECDRLIAALCPDFTDQRFPGDRPIMRQLARGALAHGITGE